VLGAAAIMSNGTVQGRCGTAAVAMAAHKRNVPVLFTCETYKLCDKARSRCRH
jgi:translation initiation factor eIF-2B subunit delta